MNNNVNSNIESAGGAVQNNGNMTAQLKAFKEGKEMVEILEEMPPKDFAAAKAEIMTDAEKQSDKVYQFAATVFKIAEQHRAAECSK